MACTSYGGLVYEIDLFDTIVMLEESLGVLQNAARKSLSLMTNIRERMTLSSFSQYYRQLHGRGGAHVMRI